MQNPPIFVYFPYPWFTCGYKTNMPVRDEEHSNPSPLEEFIWKGPHVGPSSCCSDSQHKKITVPEVVLGPPEPPFCMNHPLPRSTPVNKIVQCQQNTAKTFWSLILKSLDAPSLGKMARQKVMSPLSQLHRAVHRQRCLDSEKMGCWRSVSAVIAQKTCKS